MTKLVIAHKPKVIELKAHVPESFYVPRYSVPALARNIRKDLIDYVGKGSSPSR